MIKNSILGKLCPVFHLRSAAVASQQNLNHWLVWPGTVPRCDSEEEHTLVGGLDIEEERRAVGEEGGSSVVENYTTSINHFYTTVFLSPSFSHFPHLSHMLSLSFSPSWPCISLSSFVLPLLLTLMVPPGFLPFILLSVPGHVLYLKHCWSPSHSPSISTSFPLWFVYMLSLLICFLLPTRDLSPVHGTVLANLEIDLSLWDGSDIVCSWNKRKCHLGHILFHTLSEVPWQDSWLLLYCGIFLPQTEKQPVRLLCPKAL